MIDAFRAFKNLPHQIAAAELLDDSLSAEQREQFQELFRSDPPEKEPSPTTGVDWLMPCLPLVKEFEGCRLEAYTCPAGVPTIGWGHTGPEVQPGLTWTQHQADDALAADLREAHAGMLKALPMATGFNGAQQAALTSWVFNVGAGAAADSTLRKRLAAGEDPNTVIREELPRWNKGGGGVLEGLVRRRAAEVALFTGGQPAAAVDAPSWPAGMVGPSRRPDLKPGDHHLIADDRAGSLTAYTHNGARLWSIPCLCRGQGGEAEWNTTGSDTPPGLYKVGQVYRDYERDPSETFSADRRAYGWYSFDLIGLEGQEGPGSRNGRDGIMIHGGGSACGWPGAWAPRQALYPTLGCIRLHNQDLRERLLPLVGMGTIWVSVLQERA
jgi:GH24 family phage-related lysozyme (muramidase)